MASMLKREKAGDDQKKGHKEEAARCFKCGKRVAADATKCNHCGARLKRDGVGESFLTSGTWTSMKRWGVILLPVIGVLVWVLSKGTMPQEAPLLPTPLERSTTNDAVEAMSSKEPTITTGTLDNTDEDIRFSDELPDDVKDENEAVRKLWLSAEGGDAASQFQLGMAYLNGNDVDQDILKGEEWLQQAAQQMNKEASFVYGTMLIQGDRVGRNVREGTVLIQQAAELDHTESQFQLGQMYEQGTLREIDMQAAIDWYQKAAEKNHAGALSNLGFLFLRGDGVEQDMATGVTYLRRAADMGMPEGLNQLMGIVRHREQREVDSNYPVMKRGDQIVLRRSNGQIIRGTFEQISETFLLVRTELGSEKVSLGDVDIGNRIRTDASFRQLIVRVGVEETLTTGKGSSRLSRDPSSLQSIVDVQEAAYQGYPEAQRRLGLAHLSGTDVRKDYPSAFVWLRMAALQGDPQAQYSLGLMYFRGLGISPNKSAALGWLSRAEEQGYQKANVFLQKHMAAAENDAQLVEEVRQKREAELAHHAKRLEEIRSDDDYNRLGLRLRK